MGVTLSKEDKEMIQIVLDRRKYALHTLIKAMNYIHGFLKDFNVSARIDKGELNPKLIVEVDIASELPFHLRDLVMRNVYKIDELLLEEELEKEEKGKR